MKPKEDSAMKMISLFAYHLFLIVCGLYLHLYGCTFLFFCESYSLWISVALLGLIGGCTYCMRAIYLQYCVKNEWDDRWIVWHVVRPFVSTICGVVSLIFVKAGLLVFEASFATSTNYGIYAFAFIAGLNVDNFMKKIESVSKELFGIKETRTSREKKEEKKSE